MSVYLPVSVCLCVQRRLNIFWQNVFFYCGVFNMRVPVAHETAVSSVIEGIDTPLTERHRQEKGGGWGVCYPKLDS